MTAWIDAFVHQFGLIGLGIGVFLEAMGGPLPGETLLVVATGFAGEGVYSIGAVATVAVLAAVTGDNLAYLIGRRYGRPVILARGARFGLTHERLARVERVLDRRGWIVVTAARFFPLLRQLNGLAAGTVGMPWLHFGLANAAGALLWVGVWAAAGYGLGANADVLPRAWQVLHGFAWVIVPPLVLATLLGGVWLRRRARAGAERVRRG